MSCCLYAPWQVTLKDNFLTEETYRDMLASCMAVVLAAQFHRRMCEETGVNLPWEPSRLSSRFNEYVFQFLRASKVKCPTSFQANLTS
jgi:hypothetical protein